MYMALRSLGRVPLCRGARCTVNPNQAESAAMKVDPSISSSLDRKIVCIEVPVECKPEGVDLFLRLSLVLVVLC
jgi:hypothetical protein